MILVAADAQHAAAWLLPAVPELVLPAGAPIYVLYDLFVDPATRGTGRGQGADGRSPRPGTP